MAEVDPWADWPLLKETFDRWARRRVLPSDVFAALPDEIKGRSGRLAGVWNTLFTQEVYDDILGVLREGGTVRDAVPRWQKILDRYGASEGLEIYSGKRWSPAYADIVFRTNTQAAYAAGRYSEMFRGDWMELAPYWLYDAILDDRTRDAHRALDGKVFRKDDAAARRYLPPSGFNCRCQAIELSEDDLRSGGHKVATGTDAMALAGPPTPGWDADRVEALVPGALRGGHGRPAAPAPPVTPAPADFPPLEPLGAAVSRSLVAAERATRAQRAEVADVLRAIDGVHGDGSLTMSPVRFGSGTKGHYRPESGRPGTPWHVSTEIKIGKDAPARMTQLAHEVGHKLDFEVLRKRGDLASVLSAILRSQAVQGLSAELRSSPGVWGRQHLKYLLTHQELWARAYAQFIAVESGDAGFAAEIVARMTGSIGYHPNSQWSDLDFAPIRTEIRAMMRRLGWLT